jgi:integrase
MPCAGGNLTAGLMIAEDQRRLRGAVLARVAVWEPTSDRHPVAVDPPSGAPVCSVSPGSMEAGWRSPCHPGARSAPAGGIRTSIVATVVRPAAPAAGRRSRARRRAGAVAPRQRRLDPEENNGEGSIRQRKDGRWEGRAFVFTSDGGEVRKSVYGATWDEVHAQMTKLKADSLGGVRVSASNQTVGEYLTYWLNEVARHRVRPSTFASYRWLANTYLVPYLGGKKLDKLRPSDVRAFLNRLKGICQCYALGKDRKRVERKRVARCCARQPRQCCEAFLSDASIRYVHRLLRAALQDAVIEELIASNVARNLRISHRYRPKFTPWSADEARRFLKVAREDRWHALYAVALAVGLRRGEALALRWSDIDTVDGVIYVRRTLQRINGQLTLGPVKTEDSERSIPVPKELLTVLTAHRAAQRAVKKAAGEKWQEHGMVFTTNLGTPIEPRNLNRHLDKLCEKAGVRRIRFHDLRHSCATLLYDQRVSIENIQDVLGHSSPTITKTIYVDATGRSSGTPSTGSASSSRIRSRADVSRPLGSNAGVNTIKGRHPDLGNRPVSCCAPEGTRTPNLLIRSRIVQV